MNNHEYYKYMDVCDIILTYRKNNIFSMLISLLSKIGINIKDKKVPIQNLSHSAIYMGEKRVAEMVVHGLTISDSVDYDKSIFDVYGIRVKGDLKFSKELMIKNILEENKLGTKYSYLQIIFLFFKKAFGILKGVGDLDKRETCSEWVAKKFSQVGIALVPGFNYCDISPSDIYFSSFIEIVYNNGK